MQRFVLSILFATACATTPVLPPAAPPRPAPVPPAVVQPDETHFAQLKQLTFGGENAEAYWRFDGQGLSLQRRAGDADCDRIYTLNLFQDGQLIERPEPVQVSSGKGATTCSHYFPGAQQLLYASTHLGGEACPPKPDMSKGYVWALYDSYDIFKANTDGSNLERLTQTPGYDAEGTVCSKDGSVLFTSVRDGDIELYRMDKDGQNQRRLTFTKGYDGGGFFNADCSKIVWRASRPKPGKELDDFKGLLAQGLVRPTKLELYVANADGSDARQVTYLNAASFAPFWYPGRDRIIFASNYGDPKQREFDLFAIDADGTNFERITSSPGFDGFPMFSPDGKWLVFASNRMTQPGQHDTDVFLARWNDQPATTPAADGGSKPAAAAATTPAAPPAAATTPAAPAAATTPAASAPAPATPAPGPTAALCPLLSEPDRVHFSAASLIRADAAWLADPAREGRGVGTQGLADAGAYIEQRLQTLGLIPIGDSRTYRTTFDVTTAVKRNASTMLELAGKRIAADQFTPLGWSAQAAARAPLVLVGYGLQDAELGSDDWKGRDVKGKIAVVRRFAPEHEKLSTPEAQRRAGDLRKKAFLARTLGAQALIVVDWPVAAAGSTELPPEAALPNLRPEGSDAGLPVVIVKRAAFEPIWQKLEAKQRVDGALEVALSYERTRAFNVLGKIAAPKPSEGALVIGAHYDHLGFGGPESLAPEEHAAHLGADDNASGTATVLEIARRLVAQRETLTHDVVIALFSGEESGLLGSAALVGTKPKWLNGALAMLNLDMVGRLRDNTLNALGSDTASEWPTLIASACDHARIECKASGDGYGPSDHMSFYTLGLPVLHFFTGAHSDYHKPSDRAELLNAAGMARVAAVVSELAANTHTLSFQRTSSAPARGDARSWNASLGTVPDYGGPPPGVKGVLLSDVRPGGGAALAGMRRGDVLIKLGKFAVGSVEDLMFVLMQARPGETVTATVLREGKPVSLQATFQEGRKH